MHLHHLKHSLLICAALCGFSVSVARAQSAPGTLDSTYNGPGTNYPAQYLVVQPGDGKAIIAGGFDGLIGGGTTLPPFARFNTGGSLDQDFVNKAGTMPLQAVTALALQPNGQVLVAGRDSKLASSSHALLLRFNADGSPDASFNVTVDDSVNDILFLPDGSFLIAGAFTTVNGTANIRHLARLNTAGVLDPNFSAFDGSALTVTNVRRLARQSDGTLLAATHVSNGDVDYLISLASTTGELQSPPKFFSLTNDGFIKDIKVDAQDRVLIVGNFDAIDDHPRANHIARYNADGSLDNNFAGDPALAAFSPDALAIQTNGKVLVGGQPSSGTALLRLDGASGVVDTTFATALTYFVQALAFETDGQNNGKVLAAGQFSINSQAPTLVRVLTATAPTTSASVTVPGTSNLWLANAAAGTTASSGQDNLNNATPYLVDSLLVTPGSTLNFSATGSVSNDPQNPVNDGPDGGPYLGSTFYSHAQENGIANLTAPINSLIGVFTDDSVPSPNNTPTGYDFSQPPGTDYTQTAPALFKPFFIGDGSTSDGTVQGVVVPTGATRLYLGSLDPSDQENNLGSFAVSITTADATPKLGPTELQVNGSTSPTDVQPGASLSFTATQDSSAAGLTVRVQSAPSATGPWTDLPDGQLNFVGSGTYVGSSSNYPTTRNTYFRAVAAAPNYPDSRSGAVGPFFNTSNPSGTPVLNTTVLRATTQKNPSPSTVVPGDTITYTFTVSNGGDADATNVKVLAHFDLTDCAYISASNGGTNNVGDVAWTLTSLPANGGTKTLSFVVQVRATAPTDGRSVNARVSSVTADAPATPSGGSASTSLTLAAPPTNAQLTVTDLAAATATNAAPTTVNTGDIVNYTFVVHNVGSTTANNVVATFSFDAADTAYQSATAGSTLSGSTVTSPSFSLAAGGTKQLAVTVKVRTDVAADGRQISARVTGVTASSPAVASPGSDPLVLILAAPVSTPVLAVSNFTYTSTETANPAYVLPGDTVTYSFTVSNTGGADATKVVVTNVFDAADTAFVSATPSTLAPVINGGTITWTLPSLARDGGSQALSFTVRVKDNANVNGQAVNDRVSSVTANSPAVAYAGSSTLSLKLAAPPNTPVVRVVGSGISSDSDPTGASVVPGDNVFYTFTLRNIGTQLAANVSATVLLNGTKFKAANNNGVGGSGNNPSVVFSNLGNLAPGDLVTLNVQAKVPGAAVVNDGSGVTFTISAALTTVKADGANPLGAQPALISSLLQPYQVATMPTANVLVGGRMIYTFTASNKTNTLTPAATVTVPIPPNTTFVSAGKLADDGSEIAGTAQYAAGNSGLVVYNLGPLGARGQGGSVVKFDLVVQVDYSVAPGSNLVLAGPTLSLAGSPAVYVEPGNAVALSTQPPPTPPSVALSKLIPDAQTLKTLLAFGPKSALQLQSGFGVTLVQQDVNGQTLRDQYGNPVLDFTAIEGLGKFLNPNVAPNSDDGDPNAPIYAASGVSAKVPTPYVTFALLLSNLGTQNADGITVKDTVPAGFDFNPNGDNVSAHQDTVLVNGKPADDTNFKYNADTRTLTFQFPNKSLKPDKPFLVLYQVNVLPSGNGGPTPGTTVSTQGAKFTSTTLLSRGTISAASDGQPVVIVTPVNFYVESKKPTGKTTPIEGNTKINLYYKNTGGQKTNDFRVVSVVPPGTSYYRSVLLNNSEQERGASVGESIDHPAIGATSGQVVFHLGKLKPGQFGVVQVEYRLEDAVVSKNVLASHQAYVPAISYGGQLPVTLKIGSHQPAPRDKRMAYDENAPAAGGATTTTRTLAYDLNIPRLFPIVYAPAAAHEGQPFDYLLAAANPTAPDAGPALYFTLPAGVELAAPLTDGGKYFADQNLIVFPTGQDFSDPNHPTYPLVKGHGSLLRKVAVRPKAGTAGKTLTASLSCQGGFGTLNMINGKLVPVQVYTLPNFYSGPQSTLVLKPGADPGANANAMTVSATATFGNGVPITPGIGLNVNSLGNATFGGADVISFNNGVAVVPLGNGNTLCLGPSSNLVAAGGGNLITQDGAGLVGAGGGNIIAQDGGGLITQDGAGLIAAGGGNLFGLANLIAQDGTGLIAQDGAGLRNGTPISGILSKLIAQDGAGLIAAGGGNVLPGGGQNFITGNGLGGLSLIGNDGSGLVPLSPLGLLGAGGELAGAGLSNLTNNSASLIAAGSGNLIAAGSGNLIAAGSGNLIAAGSGNLIAAGSGNLIAAGAGNFQGANGVVGTSDASFALHSTQAGLIAVGGGNLIAAGAGN